MCVSQNSCYSAAILSFSSSGHLCLSLSLSPLFAYASAINRCSSSFPLHTHAYVKPCINVWVLRACVNMKHCECVIALLFEHLTPSNLTAHYFMQGKQMLSLLNLIHLRTGFIFIDLFFVTGNMQ